MYSYEYSPINGHLRCEEGGKAVTIVRDQLGFSTNILSVLLFPISYVPSTLNFSPHTLSARVTLKIFGAKK